MNIAIIPARGDSKRIPRKNIKDFCGQPMLAYPIKAALQSGIVDKVVVSTDDHEIADIARQYGAQVPFMRQPNLADDYTGTSAVIRDAIRQLQQLGWDLKYCACLYATTPLLNATVIRDGYQQLLANTADYVFTSARFSFPIQRALLLTERGGVMPFDAASIGKRSQDLAPAYHDAGQLYWASAETWLDTNKQVFGDNSRMQVLPDHLVQDIDTLDDWHRAELLYKLLQQEHA
ncbi:pseudaminic acid cytidylyltransferase [Alishewanella tabrizica]|uniref:Pseudaminic acid cytidylyltransferase n=1 Tax=Alishewanella tabrizica TaxID=671278 RepID=A0ABQ2WN69_9ALTE|nr:pseudaminic acid cytidylyltransferase [Alishewanella tabrizica]GGW63290.1 pseudaminic acid cytidylyltransferase [Alishewanella tabrizica]